MKRNLMTSIAIVVAVVLLGAKSGVMRALNSDQPQSERRTQPATGGWLGIALSCAGCDGSGEVGPVIVRAVAPDGPAARLLKTGDTIVSVNRTVTDSRRVREVLLAVPRDSLIEFEMRGARGHYTVRLRRQADRLSRVGRDSLPLKYQGTFNNVSVDVLTGTAPVISRDSSGAMIIRIAEHVVRLQSAEAPR